MNDRLRFALNRIGERLWVKPLAMCVVSVAGAFVASMADDSGLHRYVPEVSADSIEELLKILSASMLVIATFAVASMIAAYASASSTATPRAFALVIADDVSQYALSTFVGAFIFSIVALVALQNGYYGPSGRLALFAMTLLVFAGVILTFLRWVDRIARLGRLGTTIATVETATADAMRRRRRTPHLGGVMAPPLRGAGRLVHGSTIGYVQRVDVGALQRHADASQLRIAVTALPGTFVNPGRALAVVTADSGEISELDLGPLARAFVIHEGRNFDDDPRFGLIVLSEIASRALSPAVNDPGTAIDILGRFVRLFVLWNAPADDGETEPVKFDRVEVPALCLDDMLDDAFTPVARDGAALVEVAVRVQKALAALAATGEGPLRDGAKRHALMALRRAERALTAPEDLAVVHTLAAFADQT